MKYPIIVITVACLLSSGAYSQILNGGFEGWTNGTPDHWFIGTLGSIKADSDAHSGKFSFHYSFNGEQGMNYFLENFDVSHNIRSNIPHAAKRLSFWYKASIHIATTKISSVVLFYQYSITDTNNKPTGYSNILSLDNSIVWRKTAFNVFPTDSTTDKFNNIELTFLFYQNGPGQANEDFYLDDIQFENDISTVSVSIKPNSLALNVLPNPIADHAHLYYDHLVNSTVSSSIFDLTGREVMKLPSVHSASGDGSIPFDCDGLPNGLYYLRFDAGGTVRMRKIIVQH